MSGAAATSTPGAPRLDLTATPRLPAHFSVRRALGEAAWARLPQAVRARFADSLSYAEYSGVFETVEASALGRLLALLCRLLGTPVAPYTGRGVPATVRVRADAAGGMVWERTYRFPGRRPCVVCSTKRADSRGALVEALPCAMRMALDVFERDGALHFVSRGYFFSLARLRLRLPSFLPPGRTHVAHIDEGGGWFRFTMTVTHPWFGQLYFQTGRFRASAP